MGEDVKGICGSSRTDTERVREWKSNRGDTGRAECVVARLEKQAEQRTVKSGFVQAETVHLLFWRDMS